MTNTKFAPGQTVGILRGLQAVGGPVVYATGTVVREVEYWRGVTEYVIDVDGHELVYRPSLLVNLPETCLGYLVPEHSAESVDGGGLCEACESRLTVKVASESYRHAVRVLLGEGATLPDVSDLKRADAMRRHPAGKGRAILPTVADRVAAGLCADCSGTGSWDDGSRCGCAL